MNCKKFYFWIKSIRLHRKITIILALCLPFFANAAGIDFNPENRCNFHISLESRQRKDPIPQFDGDEVVIPLVNVGKLLIIEARVDSLVGNFILDTGAPCLVLNRTYFRNYKTVSGYYAGGINGTLGEAQATDVGTLSFRGISYQDVDADVADLSQIENARNIKILGLMGLNLFKSFEIEIDMRNGLLRLKRCDKKGEPIKPASSTYDFVNPISIYDNTLFTKCKIAGKTLVFGLDTGAEINALDIESDDEILAKVRITGRSELAGAGDDRVEIILGRLNDFRMGELELLGMQTILTKLGDISDAYGTKLNGVLGYDFLARGRVKINVRKKELSFDLYDKLVNK